MSILLSHVAEERVLLAVDTAGGRRTDSGIVKADAGKMILVPHIGVGLAMTGNLDFLTQIYQRAVHVGGDFDTLVHHIFEERFVEQAFDVTQQLAARDGISIENGQAGAVVGHSAGANRMSGIAFERLADRSFRKFEFGHLVSPPVDVVPDSEEMMLEIAATQVEQFRDVVPGGVIGGRLVIADIRADRMSATSWMIPDGRFN